VTEALRESEEYLRKENLRLRSNIKDQYRFGKIIGKSAVMKEIYELILKAAAGNASVIIYGESGRARNSLPERFTRRQTVKIMFSFPSTAAPFPEN